LKTPSMVIYGLKLGVFLGLDGTSKRNAICLEEKIF
jgi:hypothetical protein